MAKRTGKIDDILTEIITREGGYVNHPNDRGGPTNYGVTMAALQNYRGTKVTKEDIKKLTPQEAKAIYWKTYVAPFRFVNDAQLMHLLADSAVHHGVTRTAKWLQLGLGVTPDGRPEEGTKEAYKKAQNKAAVYETVRMNRMKLLENLSKAPSQKVFAEGWQKRMEEFPEYVDRSRDYRGDPQARGGIRRPPSGQGGTN